MDPTTWAWIAVVVGTGAATLLFVGASSVRPHHLIVPALAAFMLARTLRSRLIIGWGLGAAVSIAGILVSAIFDLPTGAAIVCVFGTALIVLWIVSRVWRRTSSTQ